MFTYIWLEFMVNVGKYTVHASHAKLRWQWKILRFMHIGTTSSNGSISIAVLGYRSVIDPFD